MKYCSLYHSNPEDALFCHECGEKLPQVTKDNVCPDCKKINPPEAKFCFNCGHKLDQKPTPQTIPEPQEYYTLKVKSKKVFDKIVVSGRRIYYPNINSARNEADFKIPKSDLVHAIVDILIESEGKPYKYSVDCRTTKYIEIQWGYIRFKSNHPCDTVKISGSNMSAPLVLKNLSEYKLSIPIGTYEVEGCMYNNVKRKNVTVNESLTSETNLYFPTGYILFRSNHPCDIVKISGSQISSPIIFQNIREDKVSVPVGTYEVEAHMDGNVKKRTVTVNDAQTSEVNLHFIKKYTLTITSDVDIEFVKIDKIKQNVSTKSSSKFSIKIEEGIHEISIWVSDSKTRCVGEYQEKIALYSNEAINLQWCRLELDTNAIGNVTITRQTRKRESPYSITSPSRVFLIPRGYEYELTLIKPNNGIFKDTFKSQDTSLKRVYRWKEFKLVFDKRGPQNSKCYYKVTAHNRWEFCNSSHPFGYIYEILSLDFKSWIPECLEEKIFLLDPKTYDIYYDVICDTEGFDYESTSKKIGHLSESIVNCSVPSELTDRAKWMWLRKLIFYTTWSIGLIILILTSTHLGITYYNWFNSFIEYGYSDLIGLFLILYSILFISSLVNIWFYYKLIKKRTKRKWNIFLCSEICIIILGITSMIVFNDKSFDIVSLYLLFLWPVLSWLFVGGLSYLVYRELMIKGWSIWETMWTHK